MGVSRTESGGEPISDDKGKKKNLFSSYFKNGNIEHSVVKLATQLLTFALIYGALWGVLTREVTPGTELFSLFVLVVTCHFGGKLVELIGLPQLLGMLMVGFMFKNIQSMRVARHISTKWASILRTIALIVILLRGGMGINPSDLRRLSFVCFRLALLPCIVETATMGIASHFFLNLPWTWCFMLGFIICGVSAAIVVPGMLRIREEGLGEKKGIPTLVLAALSIDNVVAITGFGVMFGIVFAQGNIAWSIGKGPLEILVGLAYGGILGIIAWYIPRQETEYFTLYRTIIICCGGIMVTFVSQTLDFTGAGAIGCISLSFVAALKWRTEEDGNGVIAKILAALWQIFEPPLFGLIGAEVSISDLQQEVGMGTLAVLVGLIIRLITTFTITFRAGLSVKERIFVSFAWLPKATVQAALGSVALDYIRTSTSDPTLEAYGRQVLTISVLSILLTAPLGAVAISVLAPLLLKEKESISVNKRRLSFHSVSYSEDCSSSISEQTVVNYGTCSKEESAASKEEIM